MPTFPGNLRLMGMCMVEGENPWGPRLAWDRGEALEVTTLLHFFAKVDPWIVLP